MWTISQVKQRGKAALKRNYWKSVLVFLLITGLASTMVITVTNGMQASRTELQERTNELYNGNGEDEHIYTDRGISMTAFSNQNEGFSWDSDFDFDQDYSDTYDPWSYGMEPYDNYHSQHGHGFDEPRNFYETYEEPQNAFDRMLDNLPFGMLIVVTLFYALLCIALTLAVAIFIDNPLVMGGNRFFFCNLEHPADAKEICFGFDRNYRNVVRVLFYRDLYICLWSLLFLIPGIVKMYEYRMIPYLLSEHPEMSKEQAFAISREMMQGEKGKAFLLDLSFIGWIFLSAFTVGLLYIFYVGPYMQSTGAALYEYLKYNKGTSTTSYYRSVPPVTPIPGYGDPSRPTPPPMPSTPVVEAEPQQPEEESQDDNAHMFEEE